MYMPNARILHLEPNVTYIPLTCVGVLPNAKVPNANGFASQWNIGLNFDSYFGVNTSNSKVEMSIVVQDPRDVIFYAYWILCSYLCHNYVSICGRHILTHANTILMAPLEIPSIITI